MKINDRHVSPLENGLASDFRFDPGTAVPAFLTNPSMVLVELGMFRIHLVAVKIMPIADPAVPAKVYLLRIGCRRLRFGSCHIVYCSYDGSIAGRIAATGPE
jgi:hypothetical protein